ncbi:MAG: hypothetical protein ACNS61_12070 [Candidatus Wenzhouxiangella sp. M2_3B_020]
MVRLNSGGSDEQLSSDDGGAGDGAETEEQSSAADSGGETNLTLEDLGLDSMRPSGTRTRRTGGTMSNGNSMGASTPTPSDVEIREPNGERTAEAPEPEADSTETSATDGATAEERAETPSAADGGPSLGTDTLGTTQDQEQQLREQTPSAAEGGPSLGTDTVGTTQDQEQQLREQTPQATESPSLGTDTLGTDVDNEPSEAAKRANRSLEEATDGPTAATAPGERFGGEGKVEGALRDASEEISDAIGEGARVAAAGAASQLTTGTGRATAVNLATRDSVVERGVRGGLTGAGELANLPAYGVTAIEAGEIAGAGIEEATKEGDQQFTERFKGAAVDFGNDLATAAERSPVEFAGQLVGGTAVASGALTTASRVGGARTATALDVAFDPASGVRRAGSAAVRRAPTGRASRAVRREASRLRDFARSDRAQGDFLGTTATRGTDVEPTSRTTSQTTLEKELTVEQEAESELPPAEEFPSREAFERERERVAQRLEAEQRIPDESEFGSRAEFERERARARQRLEAEEMLPEPEAFSSRAEFERERERALDRIRGETETQTESQEATTAGLAGAAAGAEAEAIGMPGNNMFAEAESAAAAPMPEAAEAGAFDVGTDSEVFAVPAGLDAPGVEATPTATESTAATEALPGQPQDQAIDATSATQFDVTAERELNQEADMTRELEQEAEAEQELEQEFEAETQLEQELEQEFETEIEVETETEAELEAATQPDEVGAEDFDDFDGLDSEGDLFENEVINPSDAIDFDPL